MATRYLTKDFLEKTLAEKELAFSSQIEKSSYSFEWKTIIESILRYEKQENQFQLLKMLCIKMTDTNFETFQRVISSLDSQTQYIKTYSVLFIILQQIIALQSNVAMYKYQQAYNRLIKSNPNNVLYQSDIAGLAGVQPNKYPQKLVQQIQLGVFVLPKFAEKVNADIEEKTINNLLAWILVYQITSNEHIRQLDNFCKFIAQSCLNSFNKAKQSDATAIANLLIGIFNKCLQDFEGGENYFFLINHIPDGHIQTSILTFQNDFLQYTPEQYIRIFIKLTQASVNPQNIKLIIFISSAYLNDSNYFALRKIYQEFIIPIVVRYSKFSVLAQQQIQNLVSLYIQGFMENYKYTSQQISYFLQNYELIKRIHIEYWVRMSYLIAYRNKKNTEMVDKVVQKIKKIGGQSIAESEYQKLKQRSWKIQPSDFEQKKRYKLSKSRMSGIHNSGTNCYIISVIQAFYMGRSFPELLLKYKKEFFTEKVNIPSYGMSSTSSYSVQVRSKIIYQLIKIFNDLKTHQRKFSIERIKQYGPEQFVKTQEEQDCRQYIAAFFQKIQKQLKLLPKSDTIKQIIEKIKQMFEIRIINVIVCDKCKEKSQTQENTFIHSIDYTEQLNEEWQSTIQFSCQNCKIKKTTSKKKARIVKFPQTLIVHMKRFDFVNGKCIKLLGEGYLKRQFKNYYLAGFISHIGDSVSYGHYILYFRTQQNLTKWYKFDDDKVHEFEIENTNEIIEKNFKKQETPYIIFYKEKKVKVMGTT